MEYAGNTKPFPYDNRFDRHDFSLGGLRGWSVCHAGHRGHEKAPCYSAMLHTECFELFKQHCKHPDALHRLFRLAAWRKPWLQIPNFSLPEARDVVSLPLIARMSEAYGFRDLSGLPVEILFSIWNHCPGALLWRYALAMGIAEQLSVPEQDPTESMSLTEISSWTRGRSPILSSASDSESKTLVILDSRGIRSIERLSEGRKSPYRQSDNQRYLVIRSPEPEIKAIYTVGRGIS